MRGTPKGEPAATTRRAPADTVDERTYEFLTYVFGGGVRVQEHQKLSDPRTPVRGASLRGQLRFWWRACNPSGCSTLDQLRAREAEVWGATSAASPVIVEIVSQPKAPEKVNVFEYRQPDNKFGICRGMRSLAYGAFPLQPEQKARERWEDPGVLFDYGTKPFTVRFRYPDGLAADVREAVWAWETFGGLGARTRRGFGAVQLLSAPSRLEEARSILTGLAERPRIHGVPSLAGARLGHSDRVYRTSREAWEVGLGLLRDIRQGVHQGRNPGTLANRPGRSRWPEPDEIRRLTGKSASRHRRPEVQVQSFPRAAFGLPIVFHFKDAGDPDFDRLELRPIGKERLASPLIIRPLADAKGFRAAALNLASIRVETDPGTELLAASKRPAVQRQFAVRTDLEPTEAAAVPALVRGTTVFQDPIALYLWELSRC